MVDEPKVVVALPVYNGMPFLKVALDSVLSQTYTNLDIVVIDNASTDDTVAYIESVNDPRVTLVQNESNVGLLGNWNKSLSFADRGKYFKLMCADDILLSDAVEKEVKILESNQAAVMTAAQRTVIDDDNRVIVKNRGLLHLKGLVDGRKAVQWSVMSGSNIFGEPPAVLLRSSVVDQVGEFDDTYHYCVDFDYWARALTFGDVYAIRESTAQFRVGSSSNSLKIARKQRSQAIGEFKHLSTQGRFGVKRHHVIAGAIMATLQTEARMVLYKFLDRKNK